MSALATLVMPVHNGARFIADALDSVAAEGLDLEVVVVDDGSTDESARIATHLGVTCISQDQRGPAAARNTAIEASSAPLIAFLDSDDLIVPGALDVQLSYLADHPRADGVMGWQRYEVIGGVELPDWARADKVGQPDEVNRPSLAASVIRRSTFDRVGLFDARFELSSDVEWLLRARDAGAVIEVVEEFVRVRRLHGANLTYDADGLHHWMFEVLGARARRKRQGG